MLELLLFPFILVFYIAPLIIKSVLWLAYVVFGVFFNILFGPLPCNRRRRRRRYRIF